MTCVLDAAQKYFVSEEPDETILEILDLRLEDMGLYRVEATASSETSTATKNITFNVTVSGQCRRPSTHTDPSRPAGRGGGGE